jgi:hypothetical protein
MNKKPKKKQKMLLHFRRLRGDKGIGSFVISLGKIRYFNSSLLLKEGGKKEKPKFLHFCKHDSGRGSSCLTKHKWKLLCCEIVGMEETRAEVGERG